MFYISQGYEGDEGEGNDENGNDRGGNEDVIQ
jgi:hypothetical protein